MPDIDPVDAALEAGDDYRDRRKYKPTNVAIITFEHTDVMQPQPWPVGVDKNGDVTSGLGPDDGARIIGFGPLGRQRITVLWETALEHPESVVGLAPTFSKDNRFFEITMKVAELAVQPQGSSKSFWDKVEALAERGELDDSDEGEHEYDPLRVIYIEGEITLSDGGTSKFQFHEHGWSQDGNANAGLFVDLLTAMREAANDYFTSLNGDDS